MSKRAHQPGWEQSVGPSGRKSWRKTANKPLDRPYVTGMATDDFAVNTPGGGSGDHAQVSKDLQELFADHTFTLPMKEREEVDSLINQGPEGWEKLDEKLSNLPSDDEHYSQSLVLSVKIARAVEESPLNLELQPFSNGREYGFMVEQKEVDTDEPYKIYGAYEHRNSDDLIVNHTMSDNPSEYGPYQEDDKWVYDSSHRYERYHDAVRDVMLRTEEEIERLKNL